MSYRQLAGLQSAIDKDSPTLPEFLPLASSSPLRVSPTPSGFHTSEICARASYLSAL